VRRAPDPSDRRKTRIELIDAAIAPLQTLYGTLDSEFDAVSGQFSTAELDTVARYLDAVNAFYAPTPPAIE